MRQFIPKIRSEFELLYRGNVYVFDLVQTIKQSRYFDASADLCIDGFPRSANSYAVNLIKSVNPDLNIIHHVHSSAILWKSVKNGIPTFALIRNPVDAIVSEYIRSKYSQGEEPYVQGLLKRYHQYYDAVEKLLNSITVFSFETVTKNPTRFLDTLFSCLSMDVKVDIQEAVLMLNLRNQKEVNEDIRYTTSIPTKERDDYKEVVRECMLMKYDFFLLEELFSRIKQHSI
jgi:hypothetical protein